MEEKGRIGIPRALMFYRYFPLWKVFFEELGWNVLVSEGLDKRGNIVYFEDSCLPMKLLVTHSMTLKDRVDYLYIPRLVSLHKSYMMCPKFRGAPDIVRLAMEGTISILDDLVDLREKGHSMRESLLKTAKRLGAKEAERQQALQKAEAFFLNFQKQWPKRINHLPIKQVFNLDAPEEAREPEKTFQVAFIGHPYNLFDPDVSKEVLTFAKSLGMRIITSEMLSEKEINAPLSDLSKEIYWSSGREIVGSLFHFLSGEVDGVIFLTSFKCGIDALLQELIRRKLKMTRRTSTPFLILSLDEHSGREGLTTRLEAFRDVMEGQKKSKSEAGNSKPS